MIQKVFNKDGQFKYDGAVFFKNKDMLGWYKFFNGTKYHLTVKVSNIESHIQEHWNVLIENYKETMKKISTKL